MFLNPFDSKQKENQKTISVNPPKNQGGTSQYSQNINLNKAQQKAATTLEGSLLILASAGTGKTTTIVERYANLLAQGIHPDQILMTTFTNKAAKDMLRKIVERTHKIPQFIGTMHSLFLRILREHSTLLFQQKRFTIIDDSDKKKIIKTLLLQKKLQPDPNNVKYLLGRMSTFKNLGIRAETLKQDQTLNLEEEKRLELILDDEIVFIDIAVKNQFTSFYQDYQAWLKSNNSIDLDDILLLTHQLLEEHPELRKHYSLYFKAIMVDEAQDLNFVQMKILNLLGNNNLCLIGDDCQNIYAWRGSSNDLVFKFNENYQKITLEENYRSTEHIIKAVNKTIKAMRFKIDKSLVCTRGKGQKVNLEICNAFEEEVIFIVEEIQELIKKKNLKKDIAVLFRTNAIGKTLERECRKRKIPCHLTRSMRFFEREEIKDLLSFLKLKVNPKSLLDFERVIFLIPGIGKVKIKQLEDFARAQNVSYAEILSKAGAIIQKEDAIRTLKSLHQLLQDNTDDPLRSFLQLINYEALLEKSYADDEEKINDKRENLNVLIELFKEYSSHPEQIQQFLDGLLEIERKEKDADKITLSTIHSAKGLEWKHVFLAGCNEGTLPYYREELTPITKDDELRLFYVAISRAKDTLTITSSRFNGWKETQPSQFLEIVE